MNVEIVEQRISQIKTEIEKCISAFNFLKGQLQEATNFMEMINSFTGQAPQSTAANQSDISSSSDTPSKK